MNLQGSWVIKQVFNIVVAPNKVLKPNLHLRSAQRMASPLYALCYTLGSAGLARRYANEKIRSSICFLGFHFVFY